MTDRVAVTIEHARLNHKRVECGPGIPGCGPDCEGGPDGEPAEFCPTCGVWPCSTSVLLGEVDRQRAAWMKARELNDEMANALDSDELNDLGRALDDVIDGAIGPRVAATP